MKLIFASSNAHKVEEIRDVTASLDVEIVSLADLNYTEEIAETGSTLEENATIKSTHVLNIFKENVFSEDTGLEVQALNNEPGVYTARYAGSQKNASDNMRLLLKNLEDKENRKARFRACISLIWENEEHLFEGILNGEIAHERCGDGGFGYDPIFIPVGYDQTLGELPSSVKLEISHRARAMKKLLDFLSAHTK